MHHSQVPLFPLPCSSHQLVVWLTIDGCLPLLFFKGMYNVI